MPKSSASDLAVLGGAPLFDRPRSTSNLVSPDADAFLRYSRLFYEGGRHTNDEPVVRLMEQRFARFHGTHYCVAICNGFWALVLGIKALALPGRTEVLMPSLTYRRLADVVSWAGLVPRFCEVDRSSLAISPQRVEDEIGEQTALIIGVHPIVNCCDAPALEALSARHDIPLLFDGVESVYETVRGRKVGSFGFAECFSFHASKLMNGFEGGYLTTNDAALAERLRAMRDFGAGPDGGVAQWGTRAAMSEIHAAAALAALDGLEAQVVRNKARYRAYQRVLRGMTGVRLLEFDENERCSFKNIVVELTDEWPLSRDMTVACLNAERILARAYYSPPLHLKQAGYRTINKSLPLTEFLAQRFISMPCGHFVDETDIEAIAATLSLIAASAHAIEAAKDREA
jgi:dTDP-4-amino-4,6-dideoxygalactose transaminase